MFNLDRFKMLCKERGVTQASMFAKVGKPFNYSSDLKKIKKVPLDYIEIWAAALHTTPAYLMGETDDPSEDKKNKPTTLGELSKEDQELLEQIRAASPEKKAAILALLKDR